MHDAPTSFTTDPPPCRKNLVILKRTPLRRRILISLLLHKLPRQLHQILPQLLILRQRTPTLRHGSSTNILPALGRFRSREDDADASLHDVLLERFHADGHGVTGYGVGLVDVFGGHFGIDETGMGGVSEDVGVRGGEVAVEVAGVEDCGEFGATVGAVGTEVSVEFG